MIDGQNRTAWANALVATVAGVMLAACGGGGDSSAATAPVQTPPSTPGGNTAPTISGAPSSSVAAGSAYSFKANGADADGDTLTFSITNKPSWATFNAQSGMLTGSPQASDVGTSANIGISVSDGKASVNLAAFSVTVAAQSQGGSGSVALDWTPPTSNADGSSLSNLAGYRITYGTSPDALNQSVDLKNPGLSSYLVENLAAATWYFAISAYNSAGVESVASNPVSRAVP